MAAAAAVGCAFSRPTTTVCLYAAAALCDELDGRVARLAGQCSTFGAVLDMVTDRVSTSALLGVLAVLRPEWALVCLALQALDVASHWFQMQAASLGDSRGGGPRGPGSRASSSGGGTRIWPSRGTSWCGFTTGTAPSWPPPA